MAVAGLLLGAAEFGVGEYNKSQAKQKAEELAATRPKLGQDTIANDNLALAKSDLATGMSAKGRQAYDNASDRQFSTGLDAILKSGGSTNSIGELYGNNETGRERLAMLNDDLRLKQIQNVIETSKAVALRNKEQFQFNQQAPWMDAAQANVAARQGAANQEQSGIDTFGANAIGLENNYKQEQLYDKYFGKGTPTVSLNTTPNNNADYANWSNQQIMNNAPTYNGQPATGKFSDNAVPQTNYFQNVWNNQQQQPVQPIANNFDNNNPFTNYNYGYFNSIKRI